MNNRPKRRKRQDNPYTLTNNSGIYEIKFKGNNGLINKIEINKNIFEEFDKFELADLKEMNEYDRHIEHLEYTDEELYIKSKKKENTVEDTSIG